MSQGIAVEVLEKELQDARSKLNNLTTYLDDLISKCAITYTSLENPNIRLRCSFIAISICPRM